MSDQLYGVLREVVAAETGNPVPGASSVFTGAQRPGIERPDWRVLPRPQVAGDDPAAGYLATITVADPQQQIAQLRAARDPTPEVKLRLAATLTEVGDFDAASRSLDEVEGEDPWDWRTGWYRGVIELARDHPQDALTRFRAVYHALPGELAPKLGLALAAENADQVGDAASWYEIVSRIDPSFTAATFGLARCRLAAGDLDGTLAAYQRVPDSSSAYLEAQVARIRCLSSAGNAVPPTLERLIQAGSILEGVQLDAEQRARLSAEVLEPALSLTQHDGDQRRATLLGRPVAERDVRLGLEGAYRSLAKRAGTSSERIALVDRANRVRPRTWT
jgi:serine/threonine-protein kinase PknG